MLRSGGALRGSELMRLQLARCRIPGRRRKRRPRAREHGARGGPQSRQGLGSPPLEVRQLGTVLDAHEDEYGDRDEENEVRRKADSEQVRCPLEDAGEDADDHGEERRDEPPDGMALAKTSASKEFDDHDERRERGDDSEGVGQRAHGSQFSAVRRS